jgi:hypothetical protein
MRAIAGLDSLAGVFVAALAAACIGCGHGGGGSAQPAKQPPAAKADPAPGARPEERNHLLEAKWSEVVVKAEKEGKEVGAAVKLVAPQIRLFHAAPPPETDQERAARQPPQADTKKETPPAEIIDLAQELRKITPLDVDHIDILDGQVAFVDVSRKDRPELWLHDLQLSVENLTTRLHLADGRPALLTASGTLAHSGKLSIFITAEPFETGLTFSGRAAVVGLQTSELYRFIGPATDLHAPEGTIDIFVEFDCRNGELTGGVKPVLKNLKISPTNKNPFAVIKAWAADLAVKIFSDRVQARNAVATVIPIKGNLSGPDVQLWPTIFGVLRNAFVEGLTSGYAHLPPATAPDKEGVIKQGAAALTGSEPPKAQPTEPHDRPPLPSQETKADTKPSSQEPTP